MNGVIYSLVWLKYRIKLLYFKNKDLYVLILTHFKYKIVIYHSKIIELFQNILLPFVAVLECIHILMIFMFILYKSKACLESLK